MSQPITYVVIANWNGKETLRKCLTSLFSKTANLQFRVVIIDNASTDGSTEMIQTTFPNVTLIKNTHNVGFSKANNQGIRHALANGAENIFLLNNDVEITDGKWLETMSGILESDSEIGIVGCKLLYPDLKIQHPGGVIKIQGGYNRGECQKDIGQYNKTEFVDFVTGAALLINSNVIRKIGLLDEGFTPLYYEDTDWCVRARLCGYKVAYTPNPTLIHNCGTSANKLNQQIKLFYNRRSFIRFFLLNFQLTDIFKRIAKYESRIAIGCLLGRPPPKNCPSILDQTPQQGCVFS